MSLHDFWSELKRRRVVRVTMAYLVAAWVAVQVASNFVPALGLPPVLTTAVAVLAILGLPIVIAVGWAFDVTPRGIERTPADPERTPAAIPLLRVALAATVAIVLLFSVVYAFRRIHDDVDGDALVIVPFRVSGDAAYEYLREGMVDLLAAKFTGEVGPRAVDSRTGLVAWRRAVGEERDDLSSRDAVRLARSIGAGQVLLGEVVATPAHMVITAAIHGMRTQSPVRVEGHPDSLVQLVDRLVIQLLSLEAGEDRGRIASVTNTSLEAVRGYLAGQKEYRTGQYEAAARSFRDALNVDSTFALAALGLALARGWTGGGPELVRGNRLAWRHRDRLPARDQAFLSARLGANYPMPQAPAVALRDWEGVVGAHADWADAWYQYGDVLFHSGGTVGYEDALDRALAAFERAIELDSTFAPAHGHVLEIYAVRGDTAKLRRSAAAYFAYAPDERLGHHGWLVATMLRDETALERIRARLDSLSSSQLDEIRSLTRATGLPLTDDDRALEIAAARAVTPREHSNVLVSLLNHQLNGGRPEAARATALKILELAPDRLGPQVSRYMYPDADTSGIAAVAARFDPQPATSWSERGQIHCLRGTLEQHRGDTTVARTQLAALRAAAAADDTVRIVQMACVARLEAVQAHLQRTPHAARLLARLDSVLEHSYVPGGFREATNLISMGLHVERGEPRAALRASRRFDHVASAGLSPMLLQRARLLVELGQLDEARRTYLRYLALRPDPEPGPPTEQKRAAERELAAITGERR